MIGGTSTLVERNAERAALGEAVDETSNGGGHLVLVEGAAGIGKSSLLETGAELARDRGLLVLSARGAELEHEFAYGVAQQLFERLLHDAPDAERDRLLDGPARLAGAALGVGDRSPGAAPDAAFTVSHGLYWLLLNLAAERPILVAVDDAHWVDEASLRFLDYAARRLDGVPATLVVALRPAADVQSRALAALRSAPGIQLLEPGPLSVDGVGSVLAERHGTRPARAYVEACHAACGGNPFLLGELLEALRADGVEPVAESAAAVGALAPRAVARSVLLRVSRMPPDRGELATAVAVLGDGVELRRAAALCGLDPAAASAAADELRAAGIFAGGEELAFSHPVLREAIHGELPPGRRDRLHREAAAALRAEGAPVEQLVPHLLASAPLGDAQTVAVLREAAAVALARGSSEEAASLLRRALSEPPEAAQRADVQFELGTTEWLSGADPVAAVAHLQEATAAATGEASAERAVILARARTSLGDVDGAFADLDAAVRALPALEGDAALRLVAEHGAIGMLQPATAPRAREVLRAVGEPAGATPAELLVLCNEALERSLDGTAAESAALAERALGGGRLLEAEGHRSLAVYMAALVLLVSDRHELAAATLDAALAEAREEGSVFGFASAAAMRAVLGWRQGRVAAAEADARAAEATGAVPPFVYPLLYTSLALTLIDRDDLEAAEAAVAMTGCGPDLPELLNANSAFFARGALRLAQGRPQEALDDALELGARDGRFGLRYPPLPWRCLAAEAASRLGDDSRARELVADHLVAARHWGTQSAVGIGELTRGVVCGAEGVDALRSAVSTLAGSTARREHARALVELGSALRRSGTRAEARDPLREGLELARELGLKSLAERAHEELRVAGARPRRLQFSGAESLTASERRVAELAADGLSNREIAQALFVTVRTVENHLSRSYGKLAIGSRRELAGALGAG
jgi:DNA-binding CsgD family transcriptional regulator